jgi:SAM-dependent methyltransferase
MESEDWNRRYAAKEFIWTVKANRFLVAEAASLLPGRALDLAAGEGRNAIWLAEQGWTVRAVDFSDVAIEKGKRLAAARKVADNVDFQIADLRGYESEVHHFDLVTLMYLQIPRVEREPIFMRAARAVAPGGTFILVAHDSANLMHGYGGCPCRKLNPDISVVQGAQDWHRQNAADSLYRAAYRRILV